MVTHDIDKALAGNRNLFITGPGGVGKSYKINKYMEEHPELNFLACAPTGLAAMNVDGITMHKAFHIPIPAFTSPSFAKGNKKAIKNAMIKALINADVVLIDEISMARNAEFAYAIKVLRHAEKIKGKKIRVIVVGDFSQLPPVVTEKDKPILKKLGFHESGYCFTTQEWKSMNFLTVELTEVVRQSDKEFVEQLNKVRVGDTSSVDYFDRFVRENPDMDDAIYLCGTNAEVSNINNEYIDGLQGAPTAYIAMKQGFASSGIIDDLVLVKVGCQVLFTANDRFNNNYRNGTFGKIVALFDNMAMVNVGSRTFSVERNTWNFEDYKVSGTSLVKKPIGSITQMPFKLGKAVTIHKSQGQTFDKCIVSPVVFAAGQLYVALSRVRGPEGLQLTQKLTADMFILDPTVQKFYKNGYSWDVKKKAKTATSTKTVTAKKTTTKKSTAKKSTTTKKTTAKKSTTTKKSAAKKTTTKKTTTAKKPVAKKTTAKKSTTAKKTTAKKAR